MLFASDFGESFLLEVAAIIIIAVLLARHHLAIPLLRKKMNAQSEAIRNQLAAGDDARAAAKRLVELRRSELETARKESEAIAEQARQAAESLVADGKYRAEEEYARIVAHAAVQIELAQHQMSDEILSEMGTFVMTGAHRVVEAELDVVRHRSLIIEAIAAAESEATA